MDTPILDIRGTDILEDLSFRRHSFSPTLMKRVEDRRRFTQFWQASNSEGSLPFRERSASSRSVKRLISSLVPNFDIITRYRHRPESNRRMKLQRRLGEKLLCLHAM